MASLLDTNKFRLFALCFVVKHLFKTVDDVNTVMSHNFEIKDNMTYIRCENIDTMISLLCE